MEIVMFGALTYKRPIILVIIANIAAYAVLFLYRQPFDRNALIICLLVTGLVCTAYFIIAGLDMGDEYLFLVVSMLFSLGLIMIYRLGPVQGQKQLIWLAAGLILFFTSYILFIKTGVWQKLGLFYAAGALLLNIATILFGKKINGATNWIIIQGHSFQLSEVVKILFILFLACYFKEQEPGMLRIQGLKSVSPKTLNRVFLMTVTFTNAVLLILQKEWGTVALFFILYLVLLYVFGDSRLFLLANTVSTIPVALFGYFFIYHIRVRVDMWLNPWADASGKGYQILQSLFAIGSGGFLGTGIGSGRPDLIPAVNTDFIFSAICEELGILSGIAVILLYFILFYRGAKIVLSVKDRFYKVLSLGISVMFGMQTFIIIGGVIKLIPLTGITLPFISYGGSSLITSFISLGMLQAVSKIPSSGMEKEDKDIDKSE
jgi:cell division protein FtsW (lipid II flippase)